MNQPIGPLPDFSKASAKTADAMNDLIDAVRRFTRKMFYARMVGAGVPGWLADIISVWLPWRWIPVDWVYAVREDE